MSTAHYLDTPRMPIFATLTEIRNMALAEALQLAENVEAVFTIAMLECGAKLGKLARDRWRAL